MEPKHRAMTRGSTDIFWTALSITDKLVIRKESALAASGAASIPRGSGSDGVTYSAACNASGFVAPCRTARGHRLPGRESVTTLSRRAFPSMGGQPHRRQRPHAARRLEGRPVSMVSATAPMRALHCCRNSKRFACGSTILVSIASRPKKAESTASGTRFHCGGGATLTSRCRRLTSPGWCATDARLATPASSPRGSGGAGRLRHKVNHPLVALARGWGGPRAERYFGGRRMPAVLPQRSPLKAVTLGLAYGSCRSLCVQEVGQGVACGRAEVRSGGIWAGNERPRHEICREVALPDRISGRRPIPSRSRRAWPRLGIDILPEIRAGSAKPRQIPSLDRPCPAIDSNAPRCELRAGPHLSKAPCTEMSPESTPTPPSETCPTHAQRGSHGRGCREHDT